MIRGVVLNLHQLGAVVRLVDGRLATLPPAEVMVHRALFQESIRTKRALPFETRSTGRRLILFLSTEEPVVSATEEAFEERMNSYLKSLEEWEDPERPSSAERHAMRKKRRANEIAARVATSDGER